MDCARVTSHLVGYHLGLVADDERGTLEAHLLGCRSCLEKYLALKRAADKAAHTKNEEDRPSPEVRARLRAAVMREVASPPPRRVTLFTRRIPLYQGVALAALAAAITLAAPSLLRRASQSDHSTTSVTSVDTSRTRAESLHIY